MDRRAASLKLHIPSCSVILTWIALTAIAQAQSLPAVSTGPAIVLQPGQTQEITLKGSHLARVDQIVIANARGMQANLNRPQPTTAPTTQPAQKPTFSDSEIQIR